MNNSSKYPTNINKNTDNNNNFTIFLQFQTNLIQFFLPIIFIYILITSYILHISIFNSPLTVQIHQRISKKKKTILLFNILLKIIQITSTFYYNQNIPPNYILLITTYNILIIFSIILIIFLLSEQNIKKIILPFKQQIRFLFMINLSFSLITCLNELKYNCLTNNFIFEFASVIISIYLIYYFRKYPSNESESLLNSNITYIELQTVNKDDTTININTNNIENKSDETKLFTGRSKRKTEKFKRVNKINKILKHQKLIDLPKFEITFKEKFDIKLSSHIIDFYTSIFFYFTLKIFSKYYYNNNNNDNNKTLSKSIKNFIDLEIQLKQAFIYTPELYSKLPSLDLFPNDNTYNQTSIIETIPVIKSKISTYITTVVNESLLINENILLFLELNSDELKDKFDMNRETFLTKLLNSKEQQTNRSSSILSLSKNVNQNQSNINEIEQSSRISIVEGCYRQIDYVNTFLIVIKISSNNEYKSIQKSITDIKFLLLELKRLWKKTNTIDITLQKELDKLLSSKEFEKNNTTIKPFFCYIPSTKTNFILTLEQIIQHVIHNYDIYKSNIIINDFFTVFQRTSSQNNNIEMILKNEDNVISIEIPWTNYCRVALGYKIKIFYEIHIRISINDNAQGIVLIKKFTFKEIKTYIDMMGNELKLDIMSKWVGNCFTGVKNTRHKIRLFYISKFLRQIIKNENYFHSDKWKELFYIDYTYTLYNNNEHKNKSVNSTNDIMISCGVNPQ